MKQWPPIILFSVTTLIILYALFLVLQESLKVAPHAIEGAEARLHHHMKNSTRFHGGSLEEIRRQIFHAVYLQDTVPSFPRNWLAEANLYLTDTARTAHQLLLTSGESDSALVWSLPGLYWAAYARCPVTFVRPNPGPQVLDSIARVVSQRALPLYVLAPRSIISDEMVRALGDDISVNRIAGKNIADHAVKIAQYRDPETGFGWGRTYQRRDGYFEYVLSTPREARLAVAALPLAQSNLAAFLFISGDGSVAPATDSYLWSQRVDWFVTPSEGPFRHLWFIGDLTTYASQARLDQAFEKGPYPDKGPTALGPLEGLAIVFIALGLACGAFVFLHALLLLPFEPISLRLAWCATAALVPVLGVILYFASYRRPLMQKDAMRTWSRPASAQAASATAMGFGYGAPLMVAIGFLFGYVGFPLFFGPWAIRGADFLWGVGMVIMMIVMWAGAIIIAWAVAQYPMHRVLMSHMAHKNIWGKTLIITAISMTAVSLGMMTTSWWMHMWRLPMMPHEDSILFMGSFWLASFIGFLVAWPLNYPMVRTGLKSGDK